MTESEFEKWCTLKEPKLKWYRIVKIIEGLAPAIFLLSVGVFAFLSQYIGVEIFNQNPDSSTSVIIGALIGFLIYFFVLSRLSNFSMNKIEYISCLLNKIAKEAEFCKTSGDKKDLKRDITALQKYTEFTLKFPSPHLFKGDREKQKNFYKLLESLPGRLLYELEKGTIGEIKYGDIRNLGYQTYSDSDEKVDLLEKITKDYPNMSETKLNLFSQTIRKILADNLTKLFLVILFLIFIFYYLVFGFLGIGKDTSAIGCITLIAVAAYILFKK